MEFLGRRRRQIGELVIEACRLVETDKDVRSVHIVAPERPTYAELRRYQESARSRHVRLVVDGAGMMAIWPEAAAKE